MISFTVSQPSLPLAATIALLLPRKMAVDIRMENYAPANFYQNYYIIIFEKYLT